MLNNRQKAGNSNEGTQSDVSDSEDDEYGLSLNTANFEKIMAPVPSDKLNQIISLLAGECAKESKDELKEEDDDEEKALPNSIRSTPSRKSRRRSQPKPEPVEKVQLQVPSTHRTCRKLSAADKKFCSDNKLQLSSFLQLKALAVRVSCTVTQTQSFCCLHHYFSFAGADKQKLFKGSSIFSALCFR